jgi:hypothetical protein
MYIITNAYEIELKEVNENKYNQHPILYKDNLLYV